MNVPKAWARAATQCTTPDNRTLDVAVWGWGDEAPEAERAASSRLARLVERIRRGDPFPDAYAYGGRPLREEILQSFDVTAADGPGALLTRNRYGAVILHTAKLLFLDIDVAPPTFADRVRRLLSRSSSADDLAVARVRDALRRYAGTTFRLYRTAAGFRAIAIDRDFDPAGQDTQALMKMTGTDPAFSRLCLAQKSFRARLTPKPWRCACPLPPGEHPRTERAVQEQFAAWLYQYERASAPYATCRYIETIGTGIAGGLARELVEVHDRLTRSMSDLPLA